MLASSSNAPLRTYTRANLTAEAAAPRLPSRPPGGRPRPRFHLGQEAEVTVSRKRIGRRRVPELLDGCPPDAKKHSWRSSLELPTARDCRQCAASVTVLDGVSFAQQVARDRARSAGAGGGSPTYSGFSVTSVESLVSWAACAVPRPDEPVARHDINRHGGGGDHALSPFAPAPSMNSKSTGLGSRKSVQ